MENDEMITRQRGYSQKLKYAKLVTLSIDVLNKCGVQPPGREKRDKPMHYLMSSLQEHGMLQEPLVAILDNEYYILDGHRRIEAWKNLGHNKVTCKLVEVDSLAELQALFAEIARSTKRMTGKDAWYGWSVAEDRKSFLLVLQDRVQGHIKNLVEILGEKRSIQLGQLGIYDPSTAQIVGRITGLVATYEVKVQLSRKQIAEWIFRHRASVDTQNLIRSMRSGRGNSSMVRKLARCIATDVPLVPKKHRGRGTPTSV